MGKIQYHYVYNEVNELVHIDNITSNNKQKHQYRCIECGREMVPRLGKINTHHFAHKNSNDTCGESYLHRLGKILLKRKFESGKFPIAYKRNAKCIQYNTCPFYVESTCKGDVCEEFDLRTYYNTCIEEQTIDNFRADLLLYDNNNDKRTPVLIEIFVTHKSTKQKISSGLKVIELRVNDDIELANLIESNLAESNNVIYYGFKREAIKDIQLSKRAIHHFTLFKSGATYATNYDDTPSCSERTGNRNAILELAMDTHYLAEINIYDYGLAYAVREKLQVKNCRICKYSSLRKYPLVCNLSNKFGTPLYPDQKQASNCQYYIMAKQFVDNLIKKLPEIPTLRIK